MEHQASGFADAGATQSMDAFRQTDLGHEQGRADFFDFVGGLDGAFGKERSVAEAHLDLVATESLGEAEGKTFGDGNPFDAVFAEDGVEDVAQTGEASVVLAFMASFVAGVG